ncbi:alpha/beta hydrolase [Solwaraspora sp. WMMD406]|uniref:alpha/beta hydrolase n=1 Tax=Solwaraspora sp. WMMD406 TaxID=3016095 RepID=UPI002417EF41|nr:alpha/beta hydrolase [Solwaraspora sp. WMMD406]MDG4766918.1 alpha/beta hydrolase [Solwaraspora sp. WMMD406]
MTLDPFTAAMRRLMTAAHPDLGGTVTDAREARIIHGRARFPGGPPMATTTEHDLPGQPGVRLRVYQPYGDDTPRPVVLYLHGGGWVLCGLDTHDGVCRQLADRTGAVVVSVDYRLAPEHRFPAAADDAYAALRWVRRQAPGWRADPDRIAVAGDSAGGALAAATCLRARDLGIDWIRFQLLIYPVTDCLADRTEIDDSLLTVAHMRWFTEQYLADPADGVHPYASPLRAGELSGLPPCLLITAEHDPLRTEGEAYAARLAAAGVPTEAHRVDGMFHGVFGLGALLPVARTAEDLAVAGLRRAVGRSTVRTSEDS